MREGERRGYVRKENKVLLHNDNGCVTLYLCCRLGNREYYHLSFTQGCAHHKVMALGHAGPS